MTATTCSECGGQQFEVYRFNAISKQTGGLDWAAIAFICQGCDRVAWDSFMTAESHQEQIAGLQAAFEAERPQVEKHKRK